MGLERLEVVSLRRQVAFFAFGWFVIECDGPMARRNPQMSFCSGCWEVRGERDKKGTKEDDKKEKRKENRWSALTRSPFLF